MKHTDPDNKTTTEDMVFEFFEMSQRLLSLIKHENSILEACGCFSIENYLTHRDSLLKSYEDKACAIISMVQENVSNQGMQDLMLEEIISLKKALNDNTHQKFKVLEKIVSTHYQNPEDGDVAWH